MDFSKTAVAGNGNLLIPGMQSPNFNPVTGTGWQVNKDGSATFYNVSIPNVGAGTKVTFSSTAPVSPNTGDVWYDTADGLLAQQWNGSAWVPYQIGTGAIAAGTVTPALAAAGDTLNPNPYFAGGDISHWTLVSGALLTAVPVTGIAFPWAAQVTAPAGQNFPFIEGDHFAVSPGDPLQVTAWVNPVSAAAIGFNWYNSSGAGIGFTETDVAAGGGWQVAVNAATVPAGAAQGAAYVLLNTAATTGTEEVQATAVQVQGLIHGNTILQGTVTAAQLIAGIVIAGIIDGTTVNAATFNGSTFNGTDFIINSVGSFFYSGTPGPANLLISIAGANGNDPFGTAVQQGLTIFGPSGASIRLVDNGTAAAMVMLAASMVSNTVPAQVLASSQNAGAANEVSFVTLTSGKESGNADAALQLFSASADNTIAARAVIEFGGAVWGTITNGGSLVVDAWHNITLDAGWTVVVQPQYRLLPDGDVEVRGQATHAGTTAAVNINGSNPVPAAYRPSVTRVYRAPAAGDSAGTVGITNGGVFVMRASGFTASAVFMDGSYSL